MRYQILEYPHEGLSKKSELVSEFNDDLLMIVQNLYETMYAEKGIGLAATQVNIHQNIFVMDLSEACNTPECFINAKIIEHDGRIIEQEGCLSFPGLSVDIPRFSTITVQAFNEFGKEIQVLAEGLKARCIQHEMDHLQGITFISRLSSLKRRRAIKSFNELKKQKVKSN